MTSEHKTFHGKTLLFGEYTIIVGSEALVVPLKRYATQWTKADAQQVLHQQLRADLKKYIQHIENEKALHDMLDFNALRSAFDEGWFVQSDIPQGYGAGSSGALVANIYERFAFRSEKENVEEMRQKLAMLEAYFHGSSSGLDPLACFLGVPLRVSSEGINEVTINALPKLGIHLADTGFQSPTAPLVAYFREQLMKYSFFKKLNSGMIPAVETAINALLLGKTEQLQAAMATISAFQLEYFRPMIPQKMLQSWKTGLDKGDCLFKLCGSGGGGFMLVFTFGKSFNQDNLCNFSTFRIL